MSTNYGKSTYTSPYAKSKGKERSTDSKEISPVYMPIKSSYDADDFLDEAYISKEKYIQTVRRLDRKKNIILQGAPGVGKTFLAKRLAYSLIGKKDESRVAMIQFHQNYAYEDFVMGFRPNDTGGFNLERGLFYTFCQTAREDIDNPYFFIIDEINRGNLSKIFGELLLLIEADKRDKKFAIETTYSKEKFYIPRNLYIIGLMNTADRSLAVMDYALRRRFSFIEIEPAFGKNYEKYMKKFQDTKFPKLIYAVMKINEAITQDEALGRGFRIGHSYFSDLDTGSDEELEEIIECELVPLLEEYWGDNYEKFSIGAKLLRGSLRHV